MSETLDKIRKAFKLALDPNTPQAEQLAAWTGALRLCIANGIKSFDDFARVFTNEAKLAGIGTEPSFFKQRPGDDVPYGWEFVIPFGKHQGETLGVIARTDPNYIEWLHGQELRSSHLRRAVGAVYQWLEEHPDEA